MSRSLSLIFSFRNEEDNLPELLKRVRATFAKMPEYGYEVIFVNDVSTDRSLELLMEARRTDSRIKILTTSRPFGVSECVMAGMRHAKGDAVVYMDSDLQDPPELIEKMVRTWESSGADVVYTTRLSRKGETWAKLALTRLGYWILNRYSSVPVPADSGDFKLLSRRVVDQLVRIDEKKPFMRGLVGYLGFKQAQVLYHREPRFSGDTHYPIFGRRVINNFLDSAFISFSDAPFKIGFMLGAFAFMGSLAGALGLLVYTLTVEPLPLWMWGIDAVMFLAGFQALLFGFAGLYIGAIYLQVKPRPTYVIADSVGFDSA